jgi:hypothetical protein
MQAERDKVRIDADRAAVLAEIECSLALQLKSAAGPSGADAKPSAAPSP